ncbi:MAG: ATP-binding cassette domain-containing protein [Candidatus Andeanibacterium colombiense]|uniref:ATP-binding cassette domain-containing protein n=1 Tax=Candidatus Andeanibacterium colombiense TaxID=3121345 RepID=A0AAJ5X879_9SPHN|nr:MAG: ATP-binding cassette domain-containing protein [Sphingomonadaceae bacterium]
MIELADVRKHYEGRLVLDGVSLRIGRSEFVALVGPSGAGKTTLLKAINRLAEIDGGTVTIDGVDGSPSAIRRRIGYVFQGIGLFPHMTVAENIGLVPKLTGGETKIDELLDLVALPLELASRYPAQLSGGQAQRVGVARALAAEPAIVLMDEPFGALDPVTRAELGQAYRALHERMGLTTVMVTHDLAEALLLADRVVVLSQGRIAADLPPKELVHYTGDPAIAAMIATVRAQADRLEELAR